MQTIFPFSLSIALLASTQLRMPAPGGMASQHPRTFERYYPNLSSGATFILFLYSFIGVIARNKKKQFLSNSVGKKNITLFPQEL